MGSGVEEIPWQGRHTDNIYHFFKNKSYSVQQCFCPHFHVFESKVYIQNGMSVK